jgi:hypothetical protein
MIPITTDSRYNALINLREGKIGREIFSDREIYQEELEKVFTRAWLFVGHESQIPNPGDYKTTFVGDAPIIMVRTLDGGINALPFRRRCNRLRRVKGSRKGGFRKWEFPIRIVGSS